MSNLEKLNEAFMEVFDVDASSLDEHLNKDENSDWDSIHQLSLLSYLEDTFDIMLDGDDALGISSYVGCKEILSTKYNIEF